MAVQALTTINELLYRPLCSPNAADTLLLEIFQNGVNLFQLMERLDSIDERYSYTIAKNLLLVFPIREKDVLFLAIWRR